MALTVSGAVPSALPAAPQASTTNIIERARQRVEISARAGTKDGHRTPRRDDPLVKEPA
jgi:hypothetical protein